MHSRFDAFLRTLVAIVLLAGPGAGWAIAPTYVRDEALAKEPVIVIGTWEKAAFKNHSLVVKEDIGQVMKEMEVFTELKVTRVIRGDLKPGTYPLKIGWGIGWDLNGDNVSSGTSTEMEASVKSVAEPVIWFLHKSKSWDAKDPQEYLTIENYRSVQPVTLEPYYRMLMSPQKEKAMGELLGAKEPEVVTNALKLLVGERWPWPFQTFEDEYNLGPRAAEEEAKAAEAGRAKYGDQTGAIRAILNRKERQGTRGLALAVYAAAGAGKVLPEVRAYLKDEDPEVRAVAAAVLLRGEDEQSLPLMAAGLTGEEPADLACEAIAEAAKWKDFKAAEMLISFLQNDDYAGYSGNDVSMPALRARAALHELTGAWFPFDVEAGRKAWREVKNLPTVAAKKEALASRFPGPEVPLRLRVVGDGSKNAECEVSNVSSEPVTVARTPDLEMQRYDESNFSREAGFHRPEKLEDFTTLQPGASFRFKDELCNGFLLADPAGRKLTLSFWLTGRKCGTKAWVGTLTAEFGDGWKEDRTLTKVRTTWPNGNLKEVGQTMHGERVGSWEFFNFYGNRIGTENYTTCEMAKLNEDALENKGAGIPKPEAGAK